MTVDFETMRAAGWSALDAASLAESRGMSRLEAFKGVFTHWGAEPFAVDQLERYGSDYPSRAAQAAATVGLAAVVLAYPVTSCEAVSAFEHETAISRKVEALARADRATDALLFYDRLDPDVLLLTPLTEAEARRLVRSQRQGRSPELSVVVNPAQPYRWGWVFDPQTDPAAVPVGRGWPANEPNPFLVDRYTGVAFEIDTGESTEVYTRRYEGTGWPFPR